MSENFPERHDKMTRLLYREVPSTAEAKAFMDSLIIMLFPLRVKSRMELGQIEERWAQLQAELLSIITPLCGKEQCCETTVNAFFNEVPLIYTSLIKDAKTYTNNDPASSCEEEVILCYPGFYAVMVHRFANVLYRLRVPILPRVLAEYAHSETGIDINPGATIGKNFYIDHGTGVVIGETSVIGDNVRIYQGVTLGAKFVEKELQGIRRHPTIEDDVIIYAGATILGGETVIGQDSVIGGNVWLTESVPPFSTVYHRAEIVIKERKNKK